MMKTTVCRTEIRDNSRNYFLFYLIEPHFIFCCYHHPLLFNEVLRKVYFAYFIFFTALKKKCMNTNVQNLEIIKMDRLLKKMCQLKD